MRDIVQELFSLQDLNYQAFHSKLLPSLNSSAIIGVRMPALHKLEKSLRGTAEAAVFLASLPHSYYEENTLHAFLIAEIRGEDDCFAAVETFLPYIDNWSTCDLLSPRVFKAHPARLLERIPVWLSSDHTYTVRFAMRMLMDHYLTDAFDPVYPQWVSSVHSEEYYLKMMVAWYFATALAFQYDAVLPYLLEHRLDRWTHNKTIQKAVDSFRITSEQKTYLKMLRRS